LKSLVEHLRDIDDLIFDNIGPIRVLFVIRNFLGYQCLLPIIKKTIVDNNFYVGLTTEHEGCFQFPDDSESQYISSKYLIKRNKAINRKWHYIFLTDQSELYFSRHATVINTGHGSAFGNACVDKSIGGGFKHDYSAESAAAPNVSLCFFDTKERLDFSILQKLQIKIDRKRCDYLVTGSAKSDDLVNLKMSDGEKNTLLEKLRINSERKNVVIYSHWTKTSFLNNFQVSNIESLCLKYPDYNFITLGHQRLWKNYDGVEIKGQLFDGLEELAERVGNFYFIPRPEMVMGTIKIADFFIGDNSSFFVESCLVDKPIFFYNHQRCDFLNPVVGLLYKKSAISFSTINDLIDGFDKVIKDGDILAENRKEVVDFFLFQPGKVTDYIVRSLKVMGRSSGPNSKSWHRVLRYCEMERGKP
jgi:CDP-Glycerol:Poly(glycerophosphate) glycerophosphotransferase